MGTDVAAAAIAFLIATITTPAGVSGAVLLVPVQVSILGVASPAVTPTNLLYNVIAVPGAVAGYARAQPWPGYMGLTRSLVMGTLPGVVIGSILRVELLSGTSAFYIVIAVVLLPLGLWLLANRQPPRRTGHQTREPLIVAMSLAVGVVGGIYGIGGGSILAPILVALGLALSEVAPAALAATFATSVAGIATFSVLALGEGGSVAPDWGLGIALGLGGLCGGFLGARLQARLPEQRIRQLLGALSVLLALHYAAAAAL